MAPWGEGDGGGVRLHGGGRLEEARRVLGPRPMGEEAGYAMGGRRLAGPMGTGPGGGSGGNAGWNDPLLEGNTTDLKRAHGVRLYSLTLSGLFSWERF